MKTVVLLFSVLAVVSAGYGPYAYNGPIHIPVITHEGVPLETPEVQAAKANHLAAVAAAYSGYGAGPVAPIAPAPIHHGLPVVAPNGLPLDTPEVAAAKAHHYAAFNEAAARNGAHSFYGAPFAITAAGPVDTPEVQHAKAAHFAAHAEASARAGHPYAHLRKRRDVYGYHIPVIGPNGVPVETPEVQHAKAAHFAAHAEASARAAHASYTPIVYGAVYGSHYGYPAIGPDGHPLETPEVQAAKAAHFAAHAQARGGFYHVPVAPSHYGYHIPVIGPNGVPVDTPEVQHAKAAHFAAHAAAAHHY